MPTARPAQAPPYNAVTDFTPVALVADLPLVLTARSDLPVRTLDEFAAYTRANQTKMQFGSAGPGSATHLGCLLVNAAIGVNVTHIPYRGGAPAMQDMLAGRIDYQCLTGGIAFRHIQERQVLGIALLTRKPWPDLPDLRTAEEQGMKGFDASTWNAFFFPKSTPAAIVTEVERHVDAECLSGLQVYDQLQLGWPKDRQIARLLPLEDTTDVDTGLSKLIRRAGSVAHQSADFGKLANGINCGHRVARCKRNELYAAVIEQPRRTDQESAGMSL